MATEVLKDRKSQNAVGNELDPKMEAVLVELCKRLGPLTKTKAVKLPYLVDLVAEHALGQTITSSKYETWEYGVVAPDVWKVMTHHQGGKRFRVRDHHYSEGCQTIDPTPEPDNMAPELTEEELEVIAWVSDTFGHWNAGDLGTLTKSLNSEFEPLQWGSNQKASTGEDAYARFALGWQILWNQLPDLPLADSSHWGEPIGDPKEFFAKTFNG